MLTLYCSPGACRWPRASRSKKPAVKALQEDDCALIRCNAAGWRVRSDPPLHR